MNITPLVCHPFAQNSKINNNSISFNAKIPEHIKAELKYSKLNGYTDLGQSKLIYSDDPEILDLLKELKNDEKVSQEFKERLLTKQDCYDTALTTRLRIANNDDLNYQIAKAMLEASPNEKTSKKMLLNSTDSRNIPIHYADAKGTELLLNCSPNKEILHKQLIHEDKYGRTAFWLRESTEKRKILLEHSDYRTQLAQLCNLNEICSLFRYKKEAEGVKEFDKLIATLPEQLAIDTLIYSAKLFDNGYGKGHLFDYYVEKFKNHPEEFKKVLLSKDQQGKILIERNLDNLDLCKKMLEASPDSQTLKLQLTKANMPIKDSNNAFYYLNLSPDTETLITQLSKKCPREITLLDTACEKPVVSKLSTNEIVKILKKVDSIEDKKDILLKEWEETNYDVENRSLVDLSSKRNVYKTIADYLPYVISKQDRNNLGESILEVIEHDSISDIDALKLARTYKDCVSQEQKQYFNEIEYFILSTNNNLK